MARPPREALIGLSGVEPALDTWPAYEAHCSGTRSVQTFDRPMTRRAIITAMLEATLADLMYRWRQFLIAVLGAGVVMALALLLAGLVGGISVETQNTVGGVGADHWILT